MLLTQSRVFYDREHAAHRLAGKLGHLRKADAIVIGVSREGAIIGYYLAVVLQLPFDVRPCNSIVHPGNTRRTIGSVCAERAVIHDSIGIPTDYIHHQIVLNKNSLKAEREFYYRFHPGAKLNDRVVVLVADVVNNADSVLAILDTVRDQRPREIYVAGTAATREAVGNLSGKAEHVVFLNISSDLNGEIVYEDNCAVSGEHLRDLMACDERLIEFDLKQKV